MSLIAMSVHDTDENKRAEYTEKTILSLLKTVNFHKHRLFIIDNDSSGETGMVYFKLKSIWKSLGYSPEALEIIFNKENIGTARAINKGWKKRLPGEHCIKMDNDVVINQKGWVEKMEEAIESLPTIGQVGLKRKDCWEWPGHDNPEYRSKLHMLPHTPGKPWVIIEQAKHIMGTCVMHNSALLDKIGYLYQPGLYGYDDVLMSWRSNLAGYICCFLPYIDINHIDRGDTPYQGWKERYAGKYTQEVSNIVDKYIDKTLPLYYEDKDNNNNEQ